MAKRGAEEQITKEGYTSDDGGEDNEGVRSDAFKPVEGRQIRGLPKRKGLGGAGVAGAGAAPATGSSSAAPSTGFSFGAANGGASGGASGGFSFSAAPPAPPAAPPAAPAASSSPFGGGFSFGKAPAAPAAAPPPAAAAAPFGGGFSFNKSAIPASPGKSAPSSPPKPFGGFSFGSKAAAPAAPPTAPKAPEPAKEPAAPPKPFGGFSFGAKATPTPAAPASSSSAAPIARPAAPASAAFRSASGPAPSQPTPPDEGEVAYWTSLRGLNTSFLSFVSQSLNANEFLDLSAVLPSVISQYEKHLREAAAKAGWKPESTPPPQTATNGSSSAPSAPVTKPPAPPSVPAAGGFSLLKPSTPSAGSTGGFTPTGVASSSSSGFSFGGKAVPLNVSEAVNAVVAEVLDEEMATEKEKEDKEKEEKAKAKDAPKFAFGTPSGSKSSSGLFSFAPSGPLQPTTPDSKTFTPSASTTTPTEPPAKLGKFGPGGSAPQLAFGGAKGTPGAASSTSPTKGFSFGGSPGATFSFGGSSSSSEKPAEKSAAPAFSFGAPPAKPAEPSKPAFSFGGSSADKPASTFSFGSSSQPPAAASTSAAKPFAFGSPGATPFAFGTPASSAPVSAGASGAATPAEGSAEPADAEPSKNLAETAGAGEEDEDTVVEQRGKLHALEGGKYVVVGLGQFKLKRAKDGSKRRLLMRADGSGAVVLNMALQASFDPKADATTIKFIGYDPKGNVKPYLLRVKTKDAAQALATALQKEVDAIKSSA